MSLRRFVLFIACAFAPAAFAAELPSARYGLAPPAAKARLALAPVDRAEVRAAESADRHQAKLVRYAVSRKARAATKGERTVGAGEWIALPDGKRLWQLAVEVPNATSIDLVLSAMYLPEGAELYFGDPATGKAFGPWTAQDHTPHGGFATPLVRGERAHLELLVPAKLDGMRVELATVHAGFRDPFADAQPKAGSCNVDSICPQGDGIRPQIRAAARYLANGGACSGQLVNNTANDGRRLFSTANHCVSSQSAANAVVVYWKYESPTCRTVGSGSNGTPLSDSIAIVQTGGAQLRMTHAPSDFTLLELNSAIPNGVDPFWNGFNRGEQANPSSASVVHHPQGDEKRISFEDQALSQNNQTINGVPGSRHWIVADWDIGTTEPGSSGSGLLDPNRRLIGVLSGGAAACGNNDFDAFGRLGVAWEGGGTPSSRLRDWLDPANTGAVTFDGNAGCSAPTVTLSGPANGTAGSTLTFSVTASGQGPFTVAWDIDNDGSFDRTTSGVAGTTQIPVAYPTATSTTVVARVTDAGGCSAQAQRAVQIASHDETATLAGAPQQVCGDNDAAIEPGEAWRVPVSITNNGGAALQGGHAVFARGTGGGGMASDTFGHQVVDSRAAGCAFSFVDISQTGTLLDPDDDDDGITAPVAVGPNGFDFFGQTVTQLTMSTNGYLSTALEDNGNDFDNTCELVPPDRGSTGGRFNVLHDDLVVQPNGSLRRQYFSTCPRPAGVGGPRGCTVFQWTNLGQFNASGAPIGNATFQALLYDGTHELVYQYQAADPAVGGSATVSIQNAAASDRAQYACNQQGAVPAGRAVCIFHPSALPSGMNATPLAIDQPAVALGNLGSGQSQTVNATFNVPTDATCGARVSLRYVGTIDERGYSMRETALLDQVVGGGGSCNVSSCAVAPKATIAARDGFFANPARFGNGVGAFNIPTATGTEFFGAWFTGERDRDPTWLIIQGPRLGNYVDAPVLRFRNTSTSPWAVASTTVGRAQVSYLTPTRYVLTWTVDGVSGGEIQSALYPAARPVPNRTGAWFAPAESGWGSVYEDHDAGASAAQVGIHYVYDAAGTARWALGDAALAGGAMPLNTYKVHCPDCAVLPDFLSFPLGAGSLTRSYTGLTTGTVDANIVWPGPLTGSFDRPVLPTQMLSAPVQQVP